MRLSRLLALAAFCIPAAGHAQTVRGAVTNDDRTGVPGIVVLLIDSSGTEVGRALTNERGEYRIAAPTPGTYRLRTLRIGYTPVLSDPVVLGPRQEIPRHLTVATVALALDTIRVTGRSQCRAHGDADAGVAMIWEQVRAALTAARVTAGSGSIGATLVTYQRTMDPAVRRVLDQASALRSGLFTRPWASLSADSLRRVGYVVEGRDGWLTYYAPDIDVLLSATFLEDHCFRLASDRDPSVVGVEFEPTRDRARIPDIRGTVWVDRRTSHLRRMEFRYVNVSREQQEAGAGGNLEFVVMANGGWAISRWHIQMPLLQRSEVGPRLAQMAGRRGGPVEQRIVIAEVRVAGGELALVTRGADTLWARPPLILLGSVVDSMSGRALAGARISLQGTDVAATTDAAGRFAMERVIPGRYILEVRTPSLDELGAAHQMQVSVVDGSEAVRVRVATAEQVANALCGTRDVMGPASKEGILVGTVATTLETVSIADVRVLVQWQDQGAGGARHGRWLDGRPDAQGFFRICGVPLGTPLTVRVAGGGASAEPLSARISEGRVARVEAVLDDVPRGGGVSGYVLADSSRAPIGAAEVVLPELGLATTTNDEGAFRMSDVPAGTYLLLVRRVGYEPLTGEIAVADNEVLERRVLLQPIVVVEEVVVEATRTSPPGFDDHRRLGLGTFFTREELARFNFVADALRGERGAEVLRGQGTEAWLAGTRGARLRAGVPVGGAVSMATYQCFAQVYVDGILVFRGDQGEHPFDINSIPIGGVEAIEWYSNLAQVPRRYASQNAPCGVLVIHTRRGQRR